MSCFAGDRHSTIAPAKINLTLRVLGARADGYHDLESVVVKVTLYDGIDLFLKDDPTIQIECTNPAVPIDARNTVRQAVESLAARTDRAPAVSIQLLKRIPPSAGLGGGSSDAAAVIQLLNRCWGTPLASHSLIELAAQLGSDVPSFLERGTVFLAGRGQTVQAVTLPWRGWIVLLFPPFGVSTATAYRAWRSRSRRADIDARTCLQPELNCAERLNQVLFNDLEQSAFAVEPRLKEIRDLVEDRTGHKFHVTGSGSTLFACCDAHEQAEDLNLRIDQLLGFNSQVTRVISCDDNI